MARREEWPERTCKPGTAGRRAQGYLLLDLSLPTAFFSSRACSGPLFHCHLPLLTHISAPITSDYACPTRVALNLCHSICGGPHNEKSLSGFQFQIFIEKSHWPSSPKHFDPGHVNLGSLLSLLWTPLGRDADPGLKLCPVFSVSWSCVQSEVQSMAGPIDRECGLGQIPSEGDWCGTDILNDTWCRWEHVMCVGCPRVSFRIIVYSKSRRLLPRETSWVGYWISHLESFFSSCLSI